MKLEKRKNSNNIYLYAGIIFIAIGVILAILPIFVNQNIEQQSIDSVKALENISHETLKANANAKAEFNFNDIQSISVTRNLAKGKINYDQIIGQIVIPSLNINLSIFNGTTNENLLAGVTTLKPNQTMGQGNFALAGHYTNSSGVLLNKLLEIKEDAIIRITDKNTIYEYKVYKNEIVPATSIHLIEDQVSIEHKKPIISIMCCYYLDNPDKRFFVFGELINTYSYEKNLMEQK